MHGRDNSKFFLPNIRYEFLICLFLVLAIFGVYLQVRNYDFVKLDDTFYLTENKNIRDGLIGANIKWAFTSNHAGYYIPVTWLSHMLDFELYGGNPGKHHLTNIFFHMLNVLLLFFFFKRTTGKLWRSGSVAMLFAIHPLHVESVAWIAERKDVLSTFFLMLTLHGYIRYIENSIITKYIITLLFFVLGLLSKPMLVTLPFVLLLMDYWPLGRLENLRDKAMNGMLRHFPRTTVHEYNYMYLILEKLPFFIFSLIFSIVTFILQRDFGALTPLDTLSIGERVANAMVSYVSYIEKLFWPFNLAVVYPHPGLQPGWHVGAACISIFLITYYLFKKAVQYPFLITGWLWYIGTFVPVIGLVQSGMQAMADRFVYIPFIGLYIIIVWGLPVFFIRWRFGYSFFFVFLQLFIFNLMVISWIQTSYWENSITLFKHTLNITTNNFLVHHNLNVALREAGKVVEADRHYIEALRIRHGSNYKYCCAGYELMIQGRFNEAVEFYANKLQKNSNSFEAYYNLGSAFTSLNRLDDAVENYLRALEIKPDFAEAYNNLGLIFLRKGKIEDAVKHFRNALKYKPNCLDAERNLKRALSDSKAISNAVAEMAEALKIDPEEISLKRKMAALSESKIKLENVVNRLDKSLSMQPGYHANNSINWGKVNAVKEEYTKMLSVFEKITNTHSDLNEAYYHVACIYARQGETATSIQWLRKAVEHGFDNWELFGIDRDLKSIEKTKYYSYLLSKNLNIEY